MVARVRVCVPRIYIFADDSIHLTTTTTHSGAANHTAYQSTVCGLVKRDLLKDVLAAFSKTRSLAEVAQVWQDRLKLAASEA